MSGPAAGLRRRFRQHVVPRAVDRLVYGPRVRDLAGEPVAAGDVVMLGDSITYRVDWAEHFPGVPVRNFGIGGDSTGGVLRRLDQVTAGRPAKVFLLIGTNDLFYAVPEDDIVANAERIVGRLRAQVPDAELYVQSVAPRRRPWAPQVRRLNERLHGVARAHDATWIDLWPIFDDDHGGLRREYSRDRLHPNADGNRAWVALLRPFVLSSPDR